eukprot:TRINITY_DN499_c0_g1_i1.p1 TRINITY_DN499_c0_g1~~TRINITY_DN499_c0_g1_i1.p1  ORF type:complete len:400 (-),score=114.86 TRINITY_DN499_c0_g1_i1:79-1254(-)
MNDAEAVRDFIQSYDVLRRGRERSPSGAGTRTPVSPLLSQLHANGSSQAAPAAAAAAAAVPQGAKQKLIVCCPLCHGSFNLHDATVRAEADEQKEKLSAEAKRAQLLSTVQQHLRQANEDEKTARTKMAQPYATLRMRQGAQPSSGARPDQIWKRQVKAATTALRTKAPYRAIPSFSVDDNADSKQLQQAQQPQQHQPDPAPVATKSIELEFNTALAECTELLANNKRTHTPERTRHTATTTRPHTHAHALACGRIRTTYAGKGAAAGTSATAAPKADTTSAAQPASKAEPEVSYAGIHASNLLEWLDEVSARSGQPLQQYLAGFAAAGLDLRRLHTTPLDKEALIRLGVVKAMHRRPLGRASKVLVREEKAKAATKTDVPPVGMGVLVDT